METSISEMIKMEKGKVNIIHALQSKWFGTQWNGNGSTIDDITWLESNTVPKPSQSEIDVEIARLQNEYPMVCLRKERNYRLNQTDWWAMQDRTMTQAQIDYRQALRDLPATANPVLDENVYRTITGVTWPEEPS